MKEGELLVPVTGSVGAVGDNEDSIWLPLPTQRTYRPTIPIRYGFSEGEVVLRPQQRY